MNDLILVSINNELRGWYDSIETQPVSYQTSRFQNPCQCQQIFTNQSTIKGPVCISIIYMISYGVVLSGLYNPPYTAFEYCPIDFERIPHAPTTKNWIIHAPEQSVCFKKSWKTQTKQTILNEMSKCPAVHESSSTCSERVLKACC